MTSDDERTAALTDLLELRVPVTQARAALEPYPWDADELVTVTRSHLVEVLDRFEAGILSADEVVLWAESVHLRDDVGREDGAEDPVNEALIEMSSPELFGPLADLVPELRERLR
jgi:hypothetical protein